MNSGSYIYTRCKMRQPNIVDSNISIDKRTRFINQVVLCVFSLIIHIIVRRRCRLNIALKQLILLCTTHNTTPCIAYMHASDIFLKNVQPLLKVQPKLLFVNRFRLVGDHECNRKKIITTPNWTKNSHYLHFFWHPSSIIKLLCYYDSDGRAMQLYAGREFIYWYL